MKVNKRNTCVTAVIAIAAWLSLGGTAMADAESAMKMCGGCHGANSNAPTIAGLSEFYHADQLYFYRDEERPCSDMATAGGETTNMCAVVADLSDDDIDAIAAHYAAMPFVAAKQDFDSALAEAGKAIHERDCAVCHTEGGSNAEDDSGMLAGQEMAYLKMMFAEYRAGDRSQPDPMQKKVMALSDDDITALLNYYASQQ
jgi:sulfide dehydrogenase cytochrome subunit